VTNRYSISVVIPTYNGEQFLAAAIESVLDQDFLPSEIILIDDCSRDSTVKIAINFATVSSVPIRLIQLPSNSGGPSRPINVGVREAIGDLILVLDQDDILHPLALKRIENAFRQFPDAECVFHLAGKHSELPQDKFERSNELIADLESSVACAEGPRIAPPGSLLPLVVRHGNFLVGYPGFCFKRSTYFTVGGVDESYRITGDTAFLTKLLRNSTSVYVPSIGYYKRNHETNACNNTPLMFYELGLVLCGIGDGPGTTVPSRLLEEAQAKVEIFAYWFRKANEFDFAISLYRSCLKLSASKIRMGVLIFKSRGERMFVFFTRRKPTLTYYTRSK